MPVKKNDGAGLDDIRPVTPTAGRRRRPSTKPKSKSASSASERRAKALMKQTRMKKQALKLHARIEDKREDPDEMVTDARPKNLGAERDNKKRKGKSTHALEAAPPGKRPSRKSTRRGANHIKPDSPQRRQATRTTRSPKNRHASMSG